MPVGEGESKFVCPIDRDYCIVISSPEYDSDAALEDLNLEDLKKTNCPFLEVERDDGSFCKIKEECIPLKQLYRINKP